jgi:hypothetical protein
MYCGFSKTVEESLRYIYIYIYRGILELSTYMPIENFQNKKISIWAANCDACDKKEEGQKEEQLVKLPC